MSEERNERQRVRVLINRLDGDNVFRSLVDKVIRFEVCHGQ